MQLSLHTKTTIFVLQTDFYLIILSIKTLKEDHRKMYIL